MNFILLSMSIDCVTMVIWNKPINSPSSTVGSWRDTKPVYGVALCIMDRPIKKRETEPDGDETPKQKKE